jgi:uncharacterized protein
LKKQSFIALFLSLFALFGVSQASNREAIKIVTGPDTGTYFAFGNNIATLSGKTAPIKVIASNGSIDNIRQIVEGKGAVALGIVQSDILGFLKRSTSKNTKKVADHLSMVFPFYDEEVHILARSDVKGLHDLQGKRVVVGEEGSGNMLTAMNILALSEVKAGRLLHLPPAEGVVAVLSGEADAMFLVGGKPVPLFSNLSALKGAKGGANAHLLESVHLIPIDDQRVYTEYSPTRLNKGDYPFMTETILTAKVNSALIAYGDRGKAKISAKECAPLQSVSRLIATHLEDLKASGHPKWKEVNLYADIAGWPRNGCVWEGKRFLGMPEAAAGAPTLTGKNTELTNDLLSIVKHGTATP